MAEVTKVDPATGAPNPATDEAYAFVDNLDNTLNQEIHWPNPGGNAGVVYPSEFYSDPDTALPGFVPARPEAIVNTWADADPGDWTQGQPGAVGVRGFNDQIIPNPTFDVGPSENIASIGLVNRNPYTDAGVESTTVENFEMTGAVQRLRRKAQDGYGPVGFSDYAGYLAQALAQDAYYLPNDDSAQADVLRAV